MANQLKMAMVNAIWILKESGWSQRRIARELGIDRETVGKYFNLWRDGPKPAINAPTGSEGSKAAKAPLWSVGQDAQKSGPESQCEPFRKVIEDKLQEGLSGQRIYQDLRDEYGFEGSYYSVRRFVRRLGENKPIPFRRMECMPGEQSQVDFGTGAPVVRPDGKRKRPHVFRIVLSFSRKGYSEVVYHQSTDNFIRRLENAFWHFGGVSRTLVIDNLKAAVKNADWYDPDIHPKIQSFCEHYGTVILPTKPYMPRHKARGIPGIRVLVGLLNLVNHYDSNSIDKACEIALIHNAFRLKTIRALIQRGGGKQQEMEFIDEHPIIRSMSDYEAIVKISLR